MLLGRRAHPISGRRAHPIPGLRAHPIPGLRAHPISGLHRLGGLCISQRVPPVLVLHLPSLTTPHLLPDATTPSQVLQPPLKYYNPLPGTTAISQKLEPLSGT